MTTSTLKSLLGRRVRISGIVLAIAAALVSTLWLSSSPAPATVEQTATTLDSALAGDTASDDDHAKLRADLKAARALDGTARADALKKVRADAKAGKYGDKVEKRADRRSDRRAAVLALLPDDLQADLKELKAMPVGDDRKAKREQIRKDALAGKYGDKVKEAAELLKKD